MGGLVIETIRPGVQFTPDAASAFRRAERQVQSEFGRNIDVNSTYRSWSYQMSMYNAWNRYTNGTGPHPGHSRAIHPKYSRHTGGTALDSDDWRNARIRQILADNGFIRNQLHVPNEQHHFEYIRSSDKNYGKPAGIIIPKLPKLIQKELANMDKAQIVHLFTKTSKTWALVGATVPGGVRTTHSQDTANAWALIYGASKNTKNQAGFNVVLAEAKAVAAAWLAQQKTIHG